MTLAVTATGTAAALLGGGFALYTYQSLAQASARDTGHFDGIDNLPLEHGLELADATAAQLRATHGKALEVRTWLEQAMFYLSVKSLYDRIFGFLGVIVLVIVLFSVTNTLAMAVLERTREIGTLRAMGATLDADAILKKADAFRLPDASGQVETLVQTISHKPRQFGDELFNPMYLSRNDALQ